jgi:hypothetical protein
LEITDLGHGIKTLFVDLQHVLGKSVMRDASLNMSLADDILGCSLQEDDFKTILGKTMCTLDFYEGEKYM